MTDAELAAARMSVLSTIAYLNPPETWKEPYSLKALVTHWIDEGYGVKEGNKYKEAFAMILGDRYFEDLKIVGFENHNGILENGMAAYCFKTGYDEAIFAFRGTNHLASVPDIVSDNAQRASALAFVERMQNENTFVRMQATGHSLGGMLAQYVTLLTDVDTSIVFNPKDFPTDIVNEYQYLEKENKMTWYKSKKDGVPFCSDKTQNHFGERILLPSETHKIKNIVSFYYENGNYLNQFDTDSNKRPGIVSGVAGIATGIISTAVAAVKGGNSSQRIKADPTQIHGLSQKMSGINIRMQDLKTQLQSSASNLDWQVASKQGIEARLSSLIKKLNQQSDKLDKHGKFLQTVCDRMATADNSISAKCKELQYMVDKVIVRAAVMPKPPRILNYGYPPRTPMPIANQPEPVPQTDLTLLSARIKINDNALLPKPGAKLYTETNNMIK